MAAVGVFMQKLNNLFDESIDVSIKKTGVYRFTKDPMYVGFCEQLAGLAVLYKSYGLLVLTCGYVLTPERLFD